MRDRRIRGVEVCKVYKSKTPMFSFRIVHNFRRKNLSKNTKRVIKQLIVDFFF